MSFELSTPIKVVALAGLLVALLAGAFASITVMRGRQHTVTGVQVQPQTHSARPSTTLKFSQAPKKVLRPVLIDANLPAPLRHALRSSREVVAVVTSPGVPGDLDAVREARAGATAAHVGFTVLDVTRAPIASALAAWAPQAVDPTVLIVKRPGTVAVELGGYADQDMVAQAALNAR
jgi:hypothetical protein